MNLLGLIIEVFTLLFDENFSTLDSTADKDVEICLSSKGYFISIFIKICEVEALRVLFEDLGDEALEFLKILSVDRLDDVDFLRAGDFEKHVKQYNEILFDAYLKGLPVTF